MLLHKPLSHVLGCTFRSRSNIQAVLPPTTRVMIQPILRDVCQTACNNRCATNAQVPKHVPCPGGAQVLAALEGNAPGASARSVGLLLAPAAERARAVPPPMLVSGRGNPPKTLQSGRGGEPNAPGSFYSRAAGRGMGGTSSSSRAQAWQAGRGAAAWEAPASPAHRGGIDINYLRLHDVRLG